MATSMDYDFVIIPTVYIANASIPEGLLVRKQPAGSSAPSRKPEHVGDSLDDAFAPIVLKSRSETRK